MIKSNQEITDPAIIEEILSRSEVCRIAMNDRESPYLLPFNYGYRDRCLYIHSAASGKKIDLLKRDGRVCFEIELATEVISNADPCKWSTFYRSVVGYGNAEILAGNAQKTEALRIILSHYGATGKTRFEAGQLESMVVLKLAIERLTGKQSENWDRLAAPDRYNLESDRLVLKEVTWNDLAHLHRLHRYPEVDEFNTLGIPASIQATRKLLDAAMTEKLKPVRKKILWSIFLKGKGTYVGEAGMSLSANRFRLGEIFYNLDPHYWGNGYATETAKRLIQFGFGALKLHRIEAGVATGNTRSIRVLEKAGMTREGLRRKILPIRGQWKDNYHYAIVENDPGDY
jgi:ribosomal-protein-alanine N-acetyltransferase